VKSSDVIIVGGGVIGLSLGWRLRRSGVHVRILERGEPAQEASHAAAGMIAICDPHNDAGLQVLAERSGALYPGFVEELETETGVKVDFRRQGTITFLDPASYAALHPKSTPLSDTDISQLEPSLQPRKHAYFLPEYCIDPRQLCAALLKAFRNDDGDLASGSPVLNIQKAGDSFQVRTQHATYAAPRVVNCAGAWAGQIDGASFPTRPVKGQMLSVVPIGHAASSGLQHVIRAPEVYLVPRSNGRIIIGSTLEEAGFDKQVEPAVIEQLRDAAAGLFPPLREMRMHEAWAGLRPGTPDGRPLLGRTNTEGYFLAAGHYRDGILLAPATAEIMTALLTGKIPPLDLRPFAPHRFQR
jgi:glycine oxidase